VAFRLVDTDAKVAEYLLEALSERARIA